MTQDHRLTVRVRGNGSSLSNAGVYLILRSEDDDEQTLTALTGSDGECELSFPSDLQPLALVVMPYSGYWNLLGQIEGDSVVVDCPPLPRDGPYGWWHASLGLPSAEKASENVVRIGLLDTGCGPHPCLAHVTQLGAFLGGKRFAEAVAGHDVEKHGTHVAGIIAARPRSEGQYVGIAPGVDLCSVRVVSADYSAHQLDMANAIEALADEHRSDLINISLGSETASPLLRDALSLAQDRGCLVLCAAGNNGGSVEYPAAFPEAVAISALGMSAWGEEGSLALFHRPQVPDSVSKEGYFLANFSAHGEEIFATGPGVGIISTVPARAGSEAPFAVLSGTSMASPAVCAALAVLLSRDADYLNVPRGKQRAEASREILRRHCRTLRMPRFYQGHGLLWIASATSR